MPDTKLSPPQQSHPATVPPPPVEAPTRLAERTILAVAGSSFVLFLLGFLSYLPNRLTGRSNPIPEVLGSAVGAALVPLLVAYIAYRVIKPRQDRTLLVAYAVVAALVFLSLLSKNAYRF